jgi:NAD(P)-dependent dehydrogenase (short-subunit alcohol dehydrogenase family)
MNLPDCEGRTAVITGASRGLGAGIAREFAARGLRLGLCSRGGPALPEGEGVLARRLDVRDEAAVEGFAAAVAERFGAIDLWINNAGVLDPVAPLREVEAADFREHIDINLTGVFLGSRAYVRHVRGRAGGGVLINISSGAAWSPYEGWSAYCAGKAGVALLTQCVALEEADQGLRAHAVAPGVVDTDMQAHIRSCSSEQFPAVDRFVEMKSADSFNTPEFVARHLVAIAFDPARASDEVDLRLPNEKE